MLVSDVNKHFPQCRPVFEKYGIAGCGGEYGPPEPLFIFAAAHRVPLMNLLQELNAAVRGEWREEEKSGERKDGRESDESEGAFKFFAGAALVVALTAGFGLGIVNLSRIVLAQSYNVVGTALKQVHAHAQVFGWVGLFIMGVALHAVPRMKMQPVRRAGGVKLSLGLMLAGIVLRTFTQPFAENAVAAWLMAGSGLLELAAVGLFVWLIGGVVVRSGQSRETYEKFIVASVAWFAVLAVWNFSIVVSMAAQGQPIVPALPEALWVHAAFFGFMSNMIFGFSLRVLPHFLGLRESKAWASNTAFVLWNLAIFLRYPTEELAWKASVLEAAAIVLFVWSLGIFARRRTKIEIKGVDNSFGWFIRLGYAWLLVVAIVPFHADIYRWSASARHTMAIGFITPLIFGVAYRVLPIFNGVNLWSNRLMRASFWHLAFGTTLACSMAIDRVFKTTWSYAWSGLAGYAVFAALIMFALNIAMTLRTRAEQFIRGATVKLTTRVTELLEVYPDLRPVLIHGGLGGLAAMKHNPPRFVTIEFAARRHDLDPQPLIKLLNEEIQRRK